MDTITPMFNWGLAGAAVLFALVVLVSIPAGFRAIQRYERSYLWGALFLSAIFPPFLISVGVWGIDPLRKSVLGSRSPEAQPVAAPARPHLVSVPTQMTPATLSATASEELEYAQAA